MVPDELRDALGWDLDSSDQVRPLLVQVDGDLNLLTNGLMINLTDMNPFEVNLGKVAA